MTTIIGTGEHATPAQVRTNLSTDPRATNAARWSIVFGTGGAGTETMVTGASDGPVLPDGTQATTYARYTWTTANTGGIPYVEYVGSNAETHNTPVGTPVAMGVYVRCSVTRDGRHRGFGFNQANAVVWSSSTPPATSLPAGVWVRVGTLFATTSATDVMDYFFNRVEFISQIMPIGTTLDVTCALIEPGATAVPDHYDGALTDTVEWDFAWTGAANASTSTATRRRTVEPLSVLTPGHARTARTITHDVLGERTDPDVTLRTATTRQGTLELFFDVEADALEADAMHSGALVMTLVDDVNPAKSMTYVTTGGEVETRREIPHARWIVTAPYREVL